MPSKVQICNLALAALGHKAFIQSIDEPSTEAIYAKLFYDFARRETLRAHPWNFAKKYETLALLGENLVTGWAYQYALPADCVKALHLTSETSDPVDFEIALNSTATQRVINTNQAEAELAYVCDLETTTLFDDTFTSAMALRLGSYMAEPITGNTQKTQALMTRWINALRAAEAYDAAEGSKEDTTAPDWIEARLGGSSTLNVTTQPAG